MDSRKILLVGDKGESGLTGPLFRLFQLAEILSSHYLVTVVGSKSVFSTLDSIQVLSHEEAVLKHLIREHDIVLCRPGLLSVKNLWQILSEKKYLVTDLFIPQPIEGLHYFSQITGAGQKYYNNSQRRLRRAIRCSDFFLCSSPSQRLFWLGAITGIRNLPVSFIVQDPHLSSLIDCVPLGISEVSSEKNKHCGLVGNRDDIFKIVWGGGLWNWTDPELLLSSILSLEENVKKNIKVIFPGIVHSDTQIPLPLTADKVCKRVENSSELKKMVELTPGWLSLEQYRQKLYTSNLGISLHRNGVESVLSWRLRIISYIEAGIPVILSENCPLAELIAEYGAGIVIPVESVEKCSQAISQLFLDREFYLKCKKAMNKIRQSLLLEKISKPLIEYCDAPRRAPDLKSLNLWTLPQIVLP